MATKQGADTLAADQAGNRSRRRSESGERQRTKSASIDDEVEGSVPLHKLHVYGSPQAAGRKANPVRKHLKGHQPRDVEQDEFTYDAEGVLDEKDPNFVPEELQDMDKELEELRHPEYKSADIEKLLEDPTREFFENGDYDNFIENMLEVDTGEMTRIHGVVVAMRLSMDRTDACRDLVSRLLVRMRETNAVAHYQMESGFDELLSRMDELRLDVPYAEHLLSSFIGKAIADDVLTPAFVDRRRSQSGYGQEGPSFMDSLWNWINMPHGLARLDRVWRSGASSRNVPELTNEMTTMLKEYLDSEDLKEAERQIREWAVPHFHHEIVYEALVMALEFLSTPGPKADVKVARLLNLVKKFYKSYLISDKQVEIGYQRVLDDFKELAVDIPTAKRDLLLIVKPAIDDGFLPSVYEAKARELMQS